MIKKTTQQETINRSYGNFSRKDSVFLEDTIFSLKFNVLSGRHCWFSCLHCILAHLKNYNFWCFSDFFNLLSATQTFEKMKICRRFWKRKMWVFQIIRYSYRYLAMIPVSVGDFFHKICKLTYYGKTTLDLNSIGIFFIKSRIILTIFILRGHKCFKDKISWHNIHWATSKELCRNGVKIELQFTATISSSTKQCCTMV